MPVCSHLRTPTRPYSCQSALMEAVTHSVGHANTHTLTHEVRSWYQQMTPVSILLLWEAKTVKIFEPLSRHHQDVLLLADESRSVVWLAVVNVWSRKLFDRGCSSCDRLKPAPFSTTAFIPHAIAHSYSLTNITDSFFTEIFYHTTSSPQLHSYTYRYPSTTIIETDLPTNTWRHPLAILSTCRYCFFHPTIMRFFIWEINIIWCLFSWPSNAGHGFCWNL